MRAPGLFRTISGFSCRPNPINTGPPGAKSRISILPISAFIFGDKEFISPTSKACFAGKSAKTPPDFGNPISLTAVFQTVGKKSGVLSSSAASSAITCLSLTAGRVVGAENPDFSGVAGIPKSIKNPSISIAAAAIEPIQRLRSPDRPFLPFKALSSAPKLPAPTPPRPRHNPRFARHSRSQLNRRWAHPHLPAPIGSDAASRPSPSSTIRRVA